MVVAIASKTALTSTTRAARTRSTGNTHRICRRAIRASSHRNITIDTEGQTGNIGTMGAAVRFTSRSVGIMDASQGLTALSIYTANIPSALTGRRRFVTGATSGYSSVVISTVGIIIADRLKRSSP